ncbi:MAG: CHAT domain-containing protein [Bacteroidales bacterium]
MFYLGRCEEYLQRPGEAEEHYLEAIRLRREQYGETSLYVSEVYISYGQFLVRQGQDSLGFHYLHLGRTGYEQIYGSKTVMLAGVHRTLALLHFGNGNVDQALDCIQDAILALLPERDTLGLLDNPATTSSLNDTYLLRCYKDKSRILGTTSRSLEAPDAKNSLGFTREELLGVALETDQEAVRLMSRILSDFPSEESRLFIAQNLRSIFALGVKHALELRDATGDVEYLNLAYELASAAKAQELRLQQEQKRKWYVNATDPWLSDNLFSVRDSIESYDVRLQLERTHPHPDSLRLAAWETRRFELVRQHDSIFQNGMPLELDRGEDFSSSRRLHRLQSALGRRTAVLEYVLDNEEESDPPMLHAFLITRSTLSCHSQRLGPGFAQDLDILRKELYRQTSRDSLDPHVGELEMALGRLYNLLIAPVDSVLTGKELIFVPNGDLFHVPFAALKLPGENGELANGRYLVEEHDLGFALSADLISEKRHPSFFRGLRSLIVSNGYQGSGPAGFQALQQTAPESEALLKKLPRARSMHATDKTGVGPNCRQRM